MAQRKEAGRIYVGIDIGKDQLDFAAPGLRLKVANNREGWDEALCETRKLKRRVQFVCEAVGYVGTGLIEFLHSRRKHVSCVSPFRVRQFAKATGRFAKTDPLDAQVISEFGSTLRPPRDPKPVKFETEFQAAMRCRYRLLKLRSAQKNSLRPLRLPELRAAIEKVIEVLSVQIDLLDELTDKMVQQNPLLREKYEAFRGVKCVGPQTAKCVLAELPEIGRVNRRAVAALAGVAPYAKDSGETTGPRHIWGGRGVVRTGLWMAALQASMHSPVLAPFYDRLRDRGKPHNVVLTAIMRKLLVHLNTLATGVERKFAAQASAESLVRATSAEPKKKKGLPREKLGKAVSRKGSS